MRHRTVLTGFGLLGLVAFVAVVALWLGRGDADAHAVQLSSIPKPNAQLAEAPEFVTINFSEPIEPSVTTVQLWDASPVEIPIAAPEFLDEQTLRVALPPDLEPGIYTVIWRNLSTVDAHTWAGSFPFTILLPGGEVPAGEVPQELIDLGAAPSDNPTLIDSTSGWVLLLGVAVMLGGVAYVLFVANPAAGALSGDSATRLRSLSRTILLVTSAIGVFLVLQGSLIQLIVQADRLGALGRVDEILSDTRFGHYLIARQALLAVALASIGLAWAARTVRMQTIAFGALLVVAFGVLLTKSLVSHAAASEGSFWTTTTDVLHLLAASLWIGGLIHAGLAMPRWLDELRGVSRTLFAADSFRRFSVLAAFSVVLLMASGTISAFVQFTSWSELWDTTYGRSLLGKFGIMVPLLGVAALNAFLLAPRVERVSMELRGAAIDEGEAAPATAERLQRLLANTVRLEAVLGVATLVAVAVMIQLQPPRAIAEATEAPPIERPPVVNEEGFFQDASQAGGLVISLRIEPAEPGLNAFEVGLGSEFGSVGEVTLVRLDFEHTDEAIPGSRLELPLAGSAKFLADGGNMSIPGEYDITATVRRRGEDDVQTFFTIPIGAEAGETLAEVREAESSIWDWPFEGGRSAGAIAAIAVGAVGLAAAGGIQLRRMRRAP